MRILDVEELSAHQAAEVTGHLIEGERVEAAFRSPTAFVLLTDRRILLVEQNALLDLKVETSSYSWRAMRQFTISEPSGERGGAIRIWLGADPQPLHLRAGAGGGFDPLQRLLAAKLA